MGGLYNKTHNFDPNPNIYWQITFFSGEFATPSLFFSVTSIPAMDLIFPTYKTSMTDPNLLGR